MANKKITELSAITTIADNDVLAIVDISGPETKKIAMGNLIYGQTIYGSTLLTDINTINKNGYYTCLGTATGAPSASYSWFIEHENSNTGTVSAIQTAKAFSTTLIKRYRIKQASTWGSWIDPFGGTTPTEMTFLNGVTSNVQTQINNLSVVSCMGAYKNTNQTIPFNTPTDVIFNVVKFSKDITLNTTTGVFTITKSGLYSINVFLWYNGVSAVHRNFIDIYFTNQGANCPPTIRSDDSHQASGDISINLNQTVFIEAGATFVVKAFTGEEDTIKGSANYTNTSSQCNIFKVGEYFTA